MSAPMVAIMKLLFLCALAHTVCCLALPATTVPKTYETTTDPPNKYPEYLIVRGEHSPMENLEIKKFPTILLEGAANSDENEMEQCNDPSHRAVFSPYDYTVLIGMLVISLGIGIFYGFFKKSEGTSDEFLLGSEMSILPVTLSLTTSFITAIELLGNPAEMYFQGTQFVLIVIPMVFVIPVAIKIFYPIYYKMEITSCYEYLGIRFGKEIRMLGAVLYVIQMCFYTAVAVLAPAIALSKATGLNTKVAVVLIYVVCVFYSSQGGMKAVVIADTFQAAVLAISLVLVVILGTYEDGMVKIFATAAERDRLEFFDFNFDPTTRHTVWSVVIGGFFYWTSLFCTNQASVQKCMSLKSLRLAKIALGFAILGLVIVFLLNFYTGLIVFHHYADCDPLTAGRISASDQLLPYYIMSTYEKMYSVAGIFVAGIFAASLGTVASALNSLSAVACDDLLIDGMNIKISPDKGAFYAKWMSLGFGAVSFGLVFIVERLGGVLQATLTLNGLIGGVTLGLFVLGIAFKRANAKGAFYGGIASLVIVIFIGIVAQISNVEPDSLPVSVENCDCQVNITQIVQVLVQEELLPKEKGFTDWPIFKLSFMWYSMIGCLLTLLLGLIISFAVDAVQERRVFKINSSKTTNNFTAAPEIKIPRERKLKPTIMPNIIVDAKPVFSEANGHVNHAIRLDDE